MGNPSESSSTGQQPGSSAKPPFGSLAQIQPQSKEVGKRSSDQPVQQPQPIKPITSPREVQQVFDNMISQAATGLDMDAMQEMMSSRIAFEMKERDREEDEKEDVLGKRERVEESEEKERKEFKEEVREKEEVQQQLAEEIEKRMPENEGVIKERIDNTIEVFEGTGLVEIAERVQESIAADRLEDVRENVKEMKEVLKEKTKVMEKVMERLKEAGTDGCGVGGLTDSLSGLSKQDKGEFQKELDDLSKNLKANPEEAIDRVKDFINKHSRELDILKDVNSLLDNWDKMSPKEIKDELKGLSEKISKTIESLNNDAEELQRLAQTPDDFIRKVKQFFEGDKETLEAVRRTWIGAVIDFAKEKLMQSDRDKDEKRKEFWKGSLGKIGDAKNKSLEDFNKRLAEILRGKSDDLQGARSRAGRAVINHVESIADNLEKGGYAERLRNLVELDDKREIRGSLERMAEELRTVGRKAEELLDQARKGNLKGMFDELGKPTGDMGVCGRIVVKAVDRNRMKAKNEMIKQLDKELYAPVEAVSISRGLEDAANNGDYNKVGAMCIVITKEVERLQDTDAKLSQLLKLNKGPGRRKMVAGILASHMSESVNKKMKGGAKRG